jgi:transposase
MMGVFMSNNRYTAEFRAEAVKQITERGHSVADVAARLGVFIHSLYAWQWKLEKPTAARQADTDQAAELRRVKSELRRVTEERDILKKAAAYFAKLSG